MTISKSSNFKGKVKVLLSLILFAAILITGCGGGDDDLSLLPKVTGNDKITEATSEGPVFASQAEEDKYYADLEARLNEKLAGPSASPARSSTTGLLKITLAPVTDEIKTIATYDLAAKVIVTATVAGMEPKVVTPVWTVYSAAGTLNGTVYTAPARAETAVFTATYTEDGISKLALFRLKVTGLYSLVLDRTTDEIEMPATYDLAGIHVNAKYSDSSSQEVTTSPNLTWALTGGAGVLAGTVYTPAAKVETAVFTASYTEDGVTKTARFSLKVSGLSALTLSKTTDEITLPAVFDLSTITVKAKLSNGEIKDVIPAWALTSGTGSLSGTVYTPAAKPETAVFTASYAEPGAPITKTAQFRLTVTGLYSISLSQVTDEIQLPATYDLATELVVKALYSDKATQEITTAPNLTWTLTSGAGVLAGTVYTPAAKVETAVFTASYTDTGITKTARFSLKVIGLSSLTLNRTTDEVQSCGTYNLAEKLILTDKLSDGTTKNITTDPNTVWALTSGRGVLAGMVYTAPALAETAVITASYTEAGITKTIYFRLKVNSLISLTLSKATDEALISTPYDLAARLAVFARFSNGQTVEVTTNPDLKWTISFGSGVLNGAVYTTPERIETTTLVATYTINGVAQSARFTLKVLAALPGTKVQLVSVSINKSTDSVQVSGTYDLATLMPIAKYSDKTTGEVTLAWIVTSGGGAVAGNIYTAPANVGSVRLMGSCTAEDGSIKSVYVTLSLYSQNIYGNRGVVTAAGAVFHLSNGMELEIPGNAVEATTEINISFPNSYKALEKIPGQTFMSCSSSRNVYRLILRVPLSNGMKQDDITLTCLLDHLNIISVPISTVNNNMCTFTVTGDFGNTNSPALKSPNRDIFDNNTAGKSVICGNTTFLIYKNDPIAQNRLIALINNKDVKLSKPNCSFRWPYYKQYYDTCFAATLLMLMKGYKYKSGGELDSKFDSIYKIINKLISDKLISGFTKVGGANSCKNFVKDGDKYVSFNVDSFFDIIGTQSIPTLISQTFANNPITVQAYACQDVGALINFVPIKIAENKPVKVDSAGHSAIICGYDYPSDSYIFNTTFNTYTFYPDKMFFWINDPRDSKNPYIKIKVIDFVFETMLYNASNLPFACYVIEDSNNSALNNLQTIHISDNDQSDFYGIKFFYDRLSGDTRSSWTPESPEIFKWVNKYYYEPKEQPPLNGIEVLKILIANSAASDVNIYVKANIYSKNNASRPCDIHRPHLA